MVVRSVCVCVCHAPYPTPEAAQQPHQHIRSQLRAQLPRLLGPRSEAEQPRRSGSRTITLYTTGMGKPTLPSTLPCLPRANMATS